MEYDNYVDHHTYFHPFHSTLTISNWFPSMVGWNDGTITDFGVVQSKDAF